MRSSSLEEALREAADQARALPAPQTSGYSEVVVAACPGGEAAALEYFLALRHSGVRAVRASCIEAAVHLLPYTEGGEAIVAFSGGSRDSHLMRLASAASALEVSLQAYGPPLHPAYADQLEEYGFTYIDVGGPEPLLSMMLAAIYWAPKPWAARRERLERELERIEEAASWAAEALSGALSALSQGTDVVAYTPSTEAGARFLAARDLARYLAPLHEVPGLRGKRVLALYASVEEHAFKQPLLAARMRGVELHEARVNTDPLTASIYVALASLNLLYKG